MAERNFVVWDGKTGEEKRTEAVAAKSKPLSQPGQASSPPDPEVVERPTRRKYTAEYKLSIIRKADACDPGELGALLRGEGLYFSNLACWRRQLADGELAALAPKKRGRKKQPVNPLASHVNQLTHENERLRRRLTQAEKIIDVQKKISELLGGIPLVNLDM